MLPNKMRISERATNSLRRFQSNTGLTVNIGARLALFSSIERGFKFDFNKDEVELNGRELDKHTWLGTHIDIAEALLNETYPNLTKQQLHKVWAGHIQDGALLLEQVTSLNALTSKL